MTDLPNSGFLPIFAVAAFIAVVLFVEAMYMIWNSYKGSDAKKVGQRLKAISAISEYSEANAILNHRTLSSVRFLERVLVRVPHIRDLDRFLLQSGLKWTIAKFLALSLLFGVGAFTMLFIATFPVYLQSSLAVVAAIFPSAIVYRMRSMRLRKMQQQLPDALDFIGRALRAGHAMPSGLKMAGEEMPDPIAAELRTTQEEINFGVSIQQALSNLSERLPITDVRYFVIAVLIQREAGGNLTEVFDNLSKLIRKRLKFHARVRVLTTEGRMSAWVLGLLPFCLAALLNLANPEFISVMWTDPIGINITNVVLTMMGLGAIWLYKLVRIRA